MLQAQVMSHFKTIESEMFGFDTIEKEVSTCENIFTSEHVEFGSDSVQMHRVSDTGFNANIDLRPRPRHLRHWGLVLIFDENIDFSSHQSGIYFAKVIAVSNAKYQILKIIKK